MSDFDWVKNSSDEQLDTLYEKYVRLPNIQRIPKSKVWLTAITIATGFFSGIWLLDDIINRLSWHHALLFAFFLAGSYALIKLILSENYQTKRAEAIRRELERRSHK